MYDHMDHVKDYRKRLADKICEYMQMGVSDNSAIAIGEMLDTLGKVDNYLDGGSVERLTDAEIQDWNEHMENADGVKLPYWTIEQTNAVAKSLGVRFDHITPAEWNVTMNMKYSDYSPTFEKYGVSTPAFIGDTAKAFLFDKDGGEPCKKLYRYYKYIVLPARA